MRGIGPRDRFGRAYYSEVYRDYCKQNPPRKVNYYRSVLAAHLSDLTRPRVLDAGCAFGAFLACLTPMWSLHGIDISEYAIKRGRDELPHVCLAVASAEAIPYAGRFDAIVAFDVLEHVRDLERAGAEIAGHLTKRGTALFVVPVYDGPLGPVVRLLDRDPTHVHRESRQFWIAWARQHFEVVEWHGVLRYLLPYGPYIHWPTRRFRSFSPAILIVGRNPRREDCGVESR